MSARNPWFGDDDDAECPTCGETPGPEVEHAYDMAEALRVALRDILAEIAERMRAAAPRAWWELDGRCHDCAAGTVAQGRPCALHRAMATLTKVSAGGDDR